MLGCLIPRPCTRGKLMGQSLVKGTLPPSFIHTTWHRKLSTFSNDGEWAVVACLLLFSWRSMRFRSLDSETVKVIQLMCSWCFQEFSVIYSESFVEYCKSYCKLMTNCPLFIPCYCASVLLHTMVQVGYTTLFRFLRHTQPCACT